MTKSKEELTFYTYMGLFFFNHGTVHDSVTILIVPRPDSVDVKACRNATTGAALFKEQLKKCDILPNH